jgi:hypothetical protein
LDPCGRRFTALVIFWLVGLASLGAAADVPFPTRGISDFFAQVRGRYFSADTLAYQVAWGLSARYDDVRLADGKYLVSGCVAHYCIEKAAIIVTATGAVSAGAMIYFNTVSSCALPPDPLVVVFVKAAEGGQPELVQTLRDWATDAEHQAWRDHLADKAPSFLYSDVRCQSEPLIQATNVVVLPASGRGTLPPVPRPRPATTK